MCGIGCKRVLFHQKQLEVEYYVHVFDKFVFDNHSLHKCCYGEELVYWLRHILNAVMVKSLSTG